VPAAGIIYRLYISHFLSAWGDRMWEFAVSLLLIHIWEQSLLLPALYGATVAVANVRQAKRIALRRALPCDRCPPNLGVLCAL